MCHVVNRQIPSVNVTLTCGTYLPRLMLIRLYSLLAPQILGLCSLLNPDSGTFHADCSVKPGLQVVSLPYCLLAAAVTLPSQCAAARWQALAAQHSEQSEVKNVCNNDSRITFKARPQEEQLLGMTGSMILQIWDLPGSGIVQSVLVL